jgi:hypothetical protein
MRRSGKTGNLMAIIGPQVRFHCISLIPSDAEQIATGAGKTTLIEIIAKKAKSGVTAGQVSFTSSPPSSKPPRIGFVPQQDNVFEALLFTARLRPPPMPINKRGSLP